MLTNEKKRSQFLLPLYDLCHLAFGQTKSSDIIISMSVNKLDLIPANFGMPCLES